MISVRGWASSICHVVDVVGDQNEPLILAVLVLFLVMFDENDVDTPSDE